MRNSDFTQKLYLKTSNEQEFDSANHSGLPIDTDGFTYATVFFRQQQDSDIRRGFFQKALVVLSPHSWPGLFRYIVSSLGPIVMQNIKDTRQIDHLNQNGVKNVTNLEILKNVCSEIASWYASDTL